MEFLRAGYRALEECWRYVASLILVVVGFNLAASALNYALKQNLIGPFDDRTKGVIDLCADLALVAALSAAQAIAFSLIGKHLDRPLYKIGGWQDALRRFWGLWFTLHLIWLAINYAIDRLAESTPAALDAIFFVMLIYAIASVPVAACIMFAGRPSWKDVGNQLAPLAHLIQGTLSVALLAFFQFSLQLVFASVAIPGNGPELTWVIGGPALSASLVIIETIIFAAVWEMCRTYRDMDHDDEFDF